MKKVKEAPVAEPIDLAAMTPEQVAEYVASLQAQNAALSAAIEKVEPVEVPGMTPALWLEERIQFRAFKDNDKYKDDITVCVNGEWATIQRGKTVMIKRKHFAALEAAERQIGYSADVQDEMESKFETEVRARL